MKHVLRKGAVPTLSARRCWFFTFRAVYKASSVSLNTVLPDVSWIHC